MKKIVAVLLLVIVGAACGADESPPGKDIGVLGEGDTAAQIREIPYQGKTLKCVYDREYHGASMSCDWVAYHMDEIVRRVEEATQPE